MEIDCVRHVMSSTLEYHTALGEFVEVCTVQSPCNYFTDLWLLGNHAVQFKLFLLYFAL